MKDVVAKYAFLNKVGSVKELAAAFNYLVKNAKATGSTIGTTERSLLQ